MTASTALFLLKQASRGVGCYGVLYATDEVMLAELGAILRVAAHEGTKNRRCPYCCPAELARLLGEPNKSVSAVWPPAFPDLSSSHAAGDDV